MINFKIIYFIFFILILFLIGFWGKNNNYLKYSGNLIHTRHPNNNKPKFQFKYKEWILIILI